MSTENDIELYRRRRRRKRRRKRILLFLLLVILVGGGVLAFTYFQDIDLSEFGQPDGGDGQATGFPVSLAGDQAVSMGTADKHLAILTDTKLRLYSTGGKLLLSSNHGYTNPVFKTAGKKVLVYDRGGGDFKIEGTRGTIAKKTLTDKIVLGELSDQGYAAIVTQSSRYSSVLHVFDPSLEETFTWYSEQQITAVDFKSSGKGCVAATIETDGGEIVSSLVGLNFSREKEEYTSPVRGVLALSVDIKASGQIQMVGDTMACSFTEDGTLKGSYSYNKKLSYYDNSFDKGTALVLSETGTQVENTVVVLGSDGLEKAVCQVNSLVKDISCDGSRVLLLGEERVVSLPLSLEDQKISACSVDARRTALIGSKAYVMDTREIQQIPLD